MEPAQLALYAAALVQAYLLGAIPFGFLLAKYIAGIDVRTVGSGNIGATNVGRVAGVKLGLASFVLDLAKGLAAATVIPFSIFVIAKGDAALETRWDAVRFMFVGEGFTDLRILCGLAAIAGHIWPVFLGFKGGKGVATSLGVMLGLAPAATLAAFGLWIVVTGFSGYVSLGSVTAAAALPVLFAVFEWRSLEELWRLLAVMVLVAAIVIWRHRGNMRRLMAGTEKRISFSRRRSG